MVGNAVLVHVSQFVYFVCVFSKGSKYTAVREGTTIAENSVCFLYPPRRERYLAVNLRASRMILILLYRSESQVFRKEHENNINVIEMGALRSICGVKLTDFVKNVEIKNRELTTIFLMQPVQSLTPQSSHFDCIYFTSMPLFAYPALASMQDPEDR